MELENPNLPDEILIEIFSRLPAKAVGRCRCLSKTWSSQLSTCQFVKLHLLNRRNNPENLLVTSSVVNSHHTIDGPIGDNAVSSRKFEIGVTWNQVLGCCNGLVLLSYRKDVFLVNPITQQHFKLPPLSLGLTGWIACQYGFGYDSLSDDYKVVVLTCWRGENERLIGVYSVRSGAWKRVDDTHGCRINGMCTGAFVNGAIHWNSICKNNDGVYVIEAFDLADDVFHEIPAAFLPVSYSDRGLLVLDGCLCMSKSLECGDIEIWMMKQYGVADSWTKFTTIAANGEWDISRILCFTGDREKLVMVTRGNNLVLYNLEDGTTKGMVVDGVRASFYRGVAFVDSLVSPNLQYSD